MRFREAVPVIATLAGIMALGNAPEAAPQFAQSLAAPESGVLSAPQSRPPLFRVPPLEPPALPQAPPVPPAPVPPPAPGAVPDPSALQALAAAWIQKPRIVCGMTLIPASPAVDPKIAMQRPAETPANPTTYTIRPVQPTMCW